MSAFTLTPAGKGIMRCRHTQPFSPEDVQSLAKFFEDYKGKLLIDLTGTTAEECVRNIKVSAHDAHCGHIRRTGWSGSFGTSEKLL